MEQPPRTNQGLPPEGDVSMQSERNSVHELRGVRYEGEQGDSEELFINSRPFEYNVNHTNEQFCKKRFVKRLPRRMRMDVPAMTA